MVQQFAPWRASTSSSTWTMKLRINATLSRLHALITLDRLRAFSSNRFHLLGMINGTLRG